MDTVLPPMPAAKLPHIRFTRDLLQEASHQPQAGTLYLVPQSTPTVRCLNVASVVVERGIEGLIAGAGPIETIAVQSDPTLDDMLAVSWVIMAIQGRTLPAAAKSYAHYAGLCREGLRPSHLPPEETLEGMFLAVRSNFADDLSSTAEADDFLKAWQPVEGRLLQACREGLDPLITPLFRDRPEFARQRAYLIRDHEVYRQDVSRGEQWRVHLPEGPPQASALILRQPKSALWKFWARSDDRAPVGGVYLLLAVEREPGHWVFSTDPIQRLPLKTLAEALQKAELASDPNGARQDPWFDGKDFGYTLVAAPRRGSRLSSRQILAIARRWAQATVHRPAGGNLPRSWLVAAGLLFCLSLAAVFLLQHRLKPPARTALPPRYESPSPVEQAARIAMNLKQGADLHILTIGVSRYADPNYDLEVADKDAQALAAAFRDRPQELFRKVYTRELLDQHATRDGILRALGELEKQVTQNDLAIVSFAGHGISDQHQDFFFLPHDYDAAKEIATTAISWDEARRSLGHLAGMVILIMDSCQSGAITRTGWRGLPELEMKTATAKALSRFAEAEKGAVVIAASLANQSAQERNDWGHGALTLALVECIRGVRIVPDPATIPLPQENDLDGLISLQEVSFYISSRVKELTHGGQAVITNHTGNLSLDDIPIAIGRRDP